MFKIGFLDNNHMQLIFDENIIYLYNLSNFLDWKFLVTLVTKIDWLVNSNGPISVYNIDMPFHHSRMEYLSVVKSNEEIIFNLYSKHIAEPKYNLIQQSIITGNEVVKLGDEINHLRKILIPSLNNKEEKENVK